MKNIVLLILSLFTIFVLILNPKKNFKNTEVVITIPNLTQKDLSYYLINEFSKYPTIEYDDGSTDKVITDESGRAEVWAMAFCGDTNKGKVQIQLDHYKFPSVYKKYFVNY